MRGQQAIGTLVIFIALVITAALAAFVLIQTTNSLQSKSVAVASKTQESFTRGVQVSELQGWADTGSDGSFTYLTFRVKLSPGSGTIDLKDIRIEVTAAGGTKYASYDYNGDYYAYVSAANLADATTNNVIYVDTSGDGAYQAGEELNNFANQFWIVKNRSIYDTTEAGEPDDYLETGEEYVLAVYFPDTIQESEDVTVSITGKNMAPASIDRITPDTIIDGSIVKYQ